MKKNLKRIIGCALALVLVFTLAACSMSAPGVSESTAPAATESAAAKESVAPAATDAGGTKKADGDITIAVVPKALDNSIFIDAKIGAEEKAKELGIKMEWVGPAKSDAAEQVNVIEGLIQKKVDGILISCNDADALKDVIDKAVDAGIPVGTFDSDSPNSKRSFYAGTDNYGIGKLGGEKMLKALPDGGKVAILTGVLGAPNLEARITGFKDAVKGSKIEVLPVQTGEDDVQKSVEVVAQFTTANPDLAGWFFDGGWPLFADPASSPELKEFSANGGKVISVDSAYPMLQFVQLGMVDQLIGQNYPKMGGLGVETIYKIIKGDTTVDLGKTVDGVNNFIDTGFEEIDKANVEEILKTKTPY
ncbi:MAG: sugar-binding protein [Oscillospiraceae bacterium]